MDPGCGHAPGWKRRAMNCLVRAIRSAIGLIIVAGIATMCIRHYQESKLNVKCEQLRIELQKLKHRKPDSPSTPPKTEIGLNACSTESQHDCSLPEKDVRDLVRRELSLYHADKTGMPDFALENLGGCVLTTRDTKTYCTENSSIFNIFSNPDTTPNRILRPSVTPGDCWAFEGNQGTVVIKLMSFVFITHVTLEHIPPKMAPSGDILSAPKTFTLWGLVDPQDPFGKHKFGTFEYKKGGRPVQTFPVQQPVNKSYRVVEVTFHDNHGNAKYTCVYRVRVHGKMDKNTGDQSDRPPS